MQSPSTDICQKGGIDWFLTRHCLKWPFANQTYDFLCLGDIADTTFVHIPNVVGLELKSPLVDPLPVKIKEVSNLSWISAYCARDGQILGDFLFKLGVPS